MLIMDHARSDPDGFIEGTRKLSWKAPPGHLEFLSHLTDRTAAMLIETGILAPENSAQELQERTQGTITVNKLTNIMLWVAAISFLTNVDDEAAYLEVIENRVEWPKPDVQRIWTAYEVCSVSREITESTLRLVVPGIMIPDVRLLQ
jgi:hypothetical protein